MERQEERRRERCREYNACAKKKRDRDFVTA